MKILAISDVVVDLVYSPAIVERFQDVDLVLSCGDLPIEYLEFISTMLGKRLYYVHGNHVQKGLLTSQGEERDGPLGCINLHRQVVDHQGLLIAGFEGSMRYRQGEHQFTDLEMERLTLCMWPRLWWWKKRRRRELDILITHAPPFGIHDGEDLCHRGFRAFLHFMDRHSPRLHLHGHMHLYRQDAPYISHYGATTVVNAYGYRIIEIDEHDRSVPPKVQTSLTW